MIARDTGKRCRREEEFQNRNIAAAAALVAAGGVIQGPYLLPWAPLLAEEDDVLVVYMQRHPDAVARSNAALRARGISAPFFTKAQADRLWSIIRPLIPNAVELEYSELRDHPLWIDDRRGFHHRQTRARA